MASWTSPRKPLRQMLKEDIKLNKIPAFRDDTKSSKEKFEAVLV
ncbi:hypothetical protein SAMN05216316_0488 [Nitrosovibrio sp. Nv6]|nr:hypothetical protein SAMN05216316_0488 [Nitrosovibrio sp. Nv6]